MAEIIFDSRTIAVLDRIDSIEDGIMAGADLLLKNGYTESHYADALLKNFYQFGNKYMISPFIILPHARPEQGVLKSGISVVLLRQSFYYKEFKEPIRLIIILAAKDSRTHLNYLKTFSKIFSNEDRFSRILNCETESQLYKELND